MKVIVDPNGPRLSWSLPDLARACFMLIHAFSQMTPSRGLAYPDCWLADRPCRYK